MQEVGEAQVVQVVRTVLALVKEALTEVGVALVHRVCFQLHARAGFLNEEVVGVGVGLESSDQRGVEWVAAEAAVVVAALLGPSGVGASHGLQIFRYGRSQVCEN